ncbi:DNA polymerase III subunit beta [Caldibacillus lycopersici]|uniref:Beta sliding clamp n=1 Tax=Perspicuibacillus lycopersici TaxID=1325689 RepID=A0AAE3ITV1_9BACI|nr:DNA polymerase III subunit beta [Perspicuibacillus lycopersici]MCU9613488.1 DNA polymerase III subunit beta [Perspicuibacillus lycopersici]
MKFYIQKERLIKSVQDVMKAVASRTTIPILVGIKIDATEEGVAFTGSDSDISIKSFIPKEEDDLEIVDIVETGSIVLQARFFGEIVKKLPEAIVEIVVEDQFKTIIRSGNAEFVIHGLDAEEYPRLPQIEEEKSYTMPTDLLKTLIKQTVFAVSTSETRPILTGVNWTFANNELTAVATDSHRLALKKAPLQSNIENNSVYNIVIPGKSLNELTKVLEDSNEPIQFVVTENQILFKAKNLLFFSRLLEGKYPDTSKLVPTESNTDVKLNSKDFLQAVDRASLLAREGKNNVIKFSTLEAGTIEISSYTPEIGKVVEKVKSLAMDGEEIKISFSAKYMMDALRAIDGTEVTIYFTGAMRPFIIKSNVDESILQLLLPVRTF